MPPPAEASTTSSFSCSCAFIMSACICWTCFSILLMFGCGISASVRCSAASSVRRPPSLLGVELALEPRRSARPRSRRAARRAGSSSARPGRRAARSAQPSGRPATSRSASREALAVGAVLDLALAERGRLRDTRARARRPRARPGRASRQQRGQHLAARRRDALEHRRPQRARARRRPAGATAATGGSAPRALGERSAGRAAAARRPARLPAGGGGSAACRRGSRRRGGRLGGARPRRALLQPLDAASAAPRSTASARGRGGLQQRELELRARIGAVLHRARSRPPAGRSRARPRPAADRAACASSRGDLVGGDAEASRARSPSVWTTISWRRCAVEVAHELDRVAARTRSAPARARSAARGIARGDRVGGAEDQVGVGDVEHLEHVLERDLRAAVGDELVERADRVAEAAGRASARSSPARASSASIPSASAMRSQHRRDLLQRRAVEVEAVAAVDDRRRAPCGPRSWRARRSCSAAAPRAS